MRKTRFFALCCAVVMCICALPAQALTGEGTRAAQTLEALNVVRGAYNVNDPATRNQAAVILVRLAGAEKAAAADKTHITFGDMPAWAAPSIRYAYGQGWVTGVTGTEFGGERTITANAYCTALMRMLGYSREDFDSNNAVAFARHMAAAARDYDGELTRGDLFELSASALTTTYKGSEETVLDRLVSSGATTAAAVAALGLDGGELTARQISDRYTAAVFQLDMYEDTEKYSKGEPSGNASGFFITADGLAVTNHHGITDCVAGTVTLVSGEQYPIENVVYYDAGIDIAVIRVSTTSVTGVKTPGFVHLEMAARDTLRAGDTVYTISNPLGLGLTISSGIISDVSRQLDSYTEPCIMSTADISQGSSGGALLNAYGQVIGVTSGAYVFGNNMYLAVAIDPAINADLDTAEPITLRQLKQLDGSAAKAAS